MAQAVDILNQSGVANATAIVAASNNTGLPLGVAVGMIMKETGGPNIYGHDAGGACRGWGLVTEDNFKNDFLPVVLGGGVSNGVGPTQITYPGYFKSNPNYPWWDPYWNCVFGFNLLKSYCGGDYSWESLARAGSTYNSGNPSGTYNTYGRTFADLAVEWTDRLNGAGTDVDYEEGDDMPSAEEIANAILDAQIQRQEAEGTTTLRNEISWLPENFNRVPANVWNFKVVRNGLPSDDHRQGEAVSVGTIMAWQDAFVNDVKNAITEAVRGITNDDRVVKAVKEAIDSYIDYSKAEPGTIPAAELSDTLVVVKRGDTLKAIAKVAGKTIDELCALNPGLEPNSIVVGQRIKVKQ